MAGGRGWWDRLDPIDRFAIAVTAVTAVTTLLLIALLAFNGDHP